MKSTLNRNRNHNSNHTQAFSLKKKTIQIKQHDQKHKLGLGCHDILVEVMNFLTKKKKTKQKVKEIPVGIVNFVIKIKFIYQITISNKKLKSLGKILNYNLYYPIIHTF
jgi:hypothetical protein